MGVSKVNLGEETLVDLTGDTVNPQNLLKGATAHGANGEPIEGDVAVPTKTSELENDSGFVTAESPTFTGTPKAPTPTENTNSDQIATTAFVKTLISNLINGAPETLDTLKEIADALGENDDAVQALNAAIANKADKSQIPTVNNGTLTIQKNGSNVQTFSANQSGNATANITVPTKTSELTNDSGFKTTDNNTWKANTKDSEGYVKKGNGQANKVWKTDANGNPDWRNDESSATPLTTSLAVTQQGVSALDGTVGKVLNDKIGEINSKLVGFPDYAKATTLINNISGNTAINYTAHDDGILYFYLFGATSNYGVIVINEKQITQYSMGGNGIASNTFMILTKNDVVKISRAVSGNNTYECTFIPFKK